MPDLQTAIVVRLAASVPPESATRCGIPVLVYITSFLGEAEEGEEQYGAERGEPTRQEGACHITRIRRELVFSVEANLRKIMVYVAPGCPRYEISYAAVEEIHSKW